MLSFPTKSYRLNSRMSLNDGGNNVFHEQDNFFFKPSSPLKTSANSDFKRVPCNETKLGDNYEQKICDKASHISISPKYVKLNIGGRLYTTTTETVCAADWMISRMIKSEIPSPKDDEGFIVIDRCGAYFDYILEFLREGHVELPSNYKILQALLVEAKFYCFQEFIQILEDKLVPKCHHEMKETFIVNVQCQEHLYRVLNNATKPIICLTLNRQNNKYSYVEKADDNFVRHNELFHRLNSRFQGIVDFVIRKAFGHENIQGFFRYWVGCV